MTKPLKTSQRLHAIIATWNDFDDVDTLENLDKEVRAIIDMAVGKVDDKYEERIAKLEKRISQLDDWFAAREGEL